jgi:hypothetical protein
MAPKRKRKRSSDYRGSAKRSTRSEKKAARAPRFPDPRLPTFRVTSIGATPATEDTFIFLVDRLRLPDGKVLAWHAPLVPPFYLLTAKWLLDAGEAERRRVLASMKPTTEMDEHADLNITDDSLAMDALGKVASAVILAAGAVEAYANEAIDRLDDAASVEIERRGEKKTVEKSEMVRRLGIEEKLDLVVPKVSGVASIKGRDQAWVKFKELNELRGEVVHVKARGRTDDPDKPSIVGRLLLGEGSGCVDDAVAVIAAYEPTWIPEEARRALGLNI